MPDRNATIPSAQLEPELRWIPDAPEPEPEPNPYAVGSIWHTSWGYDQTNVEFYTVVRESKASVWLVPMGAEVRNGRLYPTDPVQWSTDPTLATAPEMHRKPRNAYGIEHPYLTLDNVRSAWPYNGGGCYDTRASGGAGH
jgi:hypothetical protein